MAKDIMSVTPDALAQIKVLLENRGKPSVGIRIGIRTKGCNGLSYTLEYVDHAEILDEKITADDVTIFVDPKAIMFILGTTMDYTSGEIESGFTFKNPNEKGRCGCGESFHV